MCNLYTNRKSAAEVARYFDAISQAESNVGGNVYPGTPGYVVAGGKVRSMTWGFPLVTADMRARALDKGKAPRPKPINNTRMDKIGSPFWKRFAADPVHRCLIPVERFAEAEGERGKMTRTWFGVHDEPLFACAGLWRESAEWGAVYSMMMTEANALVAPVHNRMPVVLSRDTWQAWLTTDFESLESFTVPFPADCMTIEPTSQLWSAQRTG